MSHHNGFFFFAADWRNNPALKSCSLGARGLWTELLALIAESETPGVLKFGSGEDWKFEPDKMTLNCRRDLGSERRLSPQNRHKIAIKSPQNRHKIAVFRALEKEIGAGRDIIARRLFELYEKGVFACNGAGFIVSSKLARQAAELENHRRRQKKYRAKSDGRVTPSYYTNLLHPPKSPHGGTGFSSSVFLNQKPKRRRPTKAQIDMQVGAPSPSVGGGNKAEKFKQVWFAAGLPPDKLYEGWVKLGADWRKIKANGGRRGAA